MTRHDVLFFGFLLLVGAILCVPELLRLAFPPECPASHLETLIGARP